MDAETGMVDEATLCIAEPNLGGSTPVGENLSPTFRTFQLRNLDAAPGFDRLGDEQRRSIRTVGAVLPFKTNNYVCEQLIDWDAVPHDPLFQLTFPQREMLDGADFDTIAGLIEHDASPAELDSAVRDVQRRLNPHPAGQADMNAAYLDGVRLDGVQHKYRETVLFFPAQGQTCHAYCTYCFRWPQFVNLDDLKFAGRATDQLVAYLRANPQITDVIFTGGDPMIMRTDLVRRYIEPLLADDLAHVNIRIGTKAPAYWPYRFTHGADADDLMRLFEEVVARGRHLAIMAHYSHPRELSTEVAKQAVRRIAATGAVVRCQAPLIRHVNDDADVWADLIRTQIGLGAVPYYLFVERDTGAKRYFEVPLARAYEIYTAAYRQVSGLGRTWRGPSMSATPGKVVVEAITEVGGERVFALKLVQGRNPAWVNRLFFAAFDTEASWLDDLRPAFGADRFFYEDELDNMRAASGASVQPVSIVPRRSPSGPTHHAPRQAARRAARHLR